MKLRSFDPSGQFLQSDHEMDSLRINANFRSFSGKKAKRVNCDQSSGDDDDSDDDWIPMNKVCAIFFVLIALVLSGIYSPSNPPHMCNGNLPYLSFLFCFRMHFRRQLYFVMKAIKVIAVNLNRLLNLSILYKRLKNPNRKRA